MPALSTDIADFQGCHLLPGVNGCGIPSMFGQPIRFASAFVFLSVLALPSSRADDQARTREFVRKGLAALESRVIYHPRPYGAQVIQRFLNGGGKRLDYRTAQGRQTAWLIAPANQLPMGKLWVVCGGNGTLALEMERICRSTPLVGDAFLLVDYPGYGECEGDANPKAIRENLQSAVALAVRELKLDPAKLPERVCALGHSLGAAVALLAVEEFHLRRAVLYAPFTSTKDMATHMLGLKLEGPPQHFFDNRNGLGELQRNKGRAWILHGTADNVIPITMSQKLAAEFPQTVTLKALPAGRHNDLHTTALKDLTEAMLEARK
jgi:uncharacterized protein